MTPLDLEVILHYHYSQEDFPRLVAGDAAPAVIEAVSRHEGVGLLELNPTQSVAQPSVYRITAMGRAFVQALCNTPLPVRCWKVGDQYFEDEQR